MLRALRLSLAAYGAPFRQWRAFLKIYWPVLLPSIVIAYSLNSLGAESATTATTSEFANAPAAGPAAPPATPPPSAATPPAAAPGDPATPSPPTDPAAALSAQDQTLTSLLLLVGIVIFVPVLAHSTFLWHRKLILDEMPPGLLRGLTSARAFFGRYILVGSAFLAILAAIMALALLYPYDLGLPVVGETPEAETAVYFYIITVGCLVFAILCARYSRGLPRLAVMAEASAEGIISEASIWRAIELPLVIFATSWPMLALSHLAGKQPSELATAFGIVAFIYFPAVFTAGLSLYYIEVVKQAAERVSAASNAPVS